MAILIPDLPLNFDEDEALLAGKVAGALGVAAEEVRNLVVLRRSIDARRTVRFLYAVKVELAGDEEAVLGRTECRSAKHAFSERFALPKPGSRPPGGRAAVVGAGPAGLAAALVLAECGYRPLVLERGKPVEERRKDVAAFAGEGRLDPDSNLLFGEGGAGCYSDGKLFARRPSVEQRYFMEALVQAGAPQDILVEARPHVGSDCLPSVVSGLRRRIESLGGEFRFGAKVRGVEVSDGRLRGLATSEGRVETDACVLAPGHSARDLFEALAGTVPLEARSFAVGVRIEHPQEEIDRRIWGKFYGHSRLPHAEYSRTFRAGANGRSAYTFCMCPGGVVLAAASEPGRVATNGASACDRAGSFGNSAFVVPVGPEDFHEEGPLAGVLFQRRLEEAAFHAGGSDYSLPVSTAGAFLGGKGAHLALKTGWGSHPSQGSCTRCREADLRGIFPDGLAEALADGIRGMSRKLSFLGAREAPVYAVESRISSPLRILRGVDGQSLAAKGLFPAGEGSGYSGGIASSAADGVRQASALVRQYAPPAS